MVFQRSYPSIWSVATVFSKIYPSIWSAATHLFLPSFPQVLLIAWYLYQISASLPGHCSKSKKVGFSSTLTTDFSEPCKSQAVRLNTRSIAGLAKPHLTNTDPGQWTKKQNHNDHREWDKLATKEQLETHIPLWNRRHSRIIAAFSLLERPFILWRSIFKVCTVAAYTLSCFVLVSCPLSFCKIGGVSM